MRKFLTSLFEGLAERFREKEPQIAILGEKMAEDNLPKTKENPKRNKPKGNAEISSYKNNPARDLMEIMEIPFLALSKNRKNPIIYESTDGTRKVKITRHTGHFLASIYDWDIILFVASKMQEILNKGTDIPPRTLVVPRHEILKSLHKHEGKKQQKDLENSLSRLKLTGIDTTIRNEDYRYRAGFGFLDSWGYTERKDIKEIHITLSQWLYDGICAKGALLKVDPAYFDLTSGLKKFLYRTARKHVGQGKEAWEFSIEKLYEKSGSEREFKKFKSDLKAVVMANNIPGYTTQWTRRYKEDFVIFKRSNLDDLLEKIDTTSIEKNNKNYKGDTINFDNPVHKIQ